MGGAEKSMAFVANEMAEKGHDVTFLAYRDDKICHNLSKSITYKYLQLETGGGSTVSDKENQQTNHYNEQAYM